MVPLALTACAEAELGRDSPPIEQTEATAQPAEPVARPVESTALSEATPGPGAEPAKEPAPGGSAQGTASKAAPRDNVAPSEAPAMMKETPGVATTPVPPAGPAAPPIVADSEDDAESMAAAAPATVAPTSSTRYRAGEDPDFAERMGWPVIGPEPLPGALLPHNRVVAYYGNPLSRRMGVLGEYDPEEMLARLDAAVAEWEAADPETPVIPALHLVAVVAQADSGTAGKYRLRMRDSLIEQVAEWAETRDALVFLDIQVGLGTLEEELPRLLPFLRRPNFHLGIDPEFSMKDGSLPGKRIGTFDAVDIDYATDLLAGWVREYDLPPKILVIHRFTRRMVTNSSKITLRPEVQIVMDMDGWGAAWLKRDSYRDYIVREPVQFAGFKIFYHNDVREEGWSLMSPADVLRLRPVPVYIQYQ